VIPASFIGFAAADLQAGVPLRSIAWFIPGNTIEVLISAIGLKYCFDGLPRLNSVRALAKYLFFAVVLAPFAGAFLSAHALAPAQLGWASEGRVLMRRSPVHHFEGVILMAGLVAVRFVLVLLSLGTRLPAPFF